MARNSKNFRNFGVTERPGLRCADSVRFMGMVHEAALSLDSKTIRRTGGVVDPIGVFAVTEFYFLLGRVYRVLIFGSVRDLFDRLKKHQ